MFRPLGVIFRSSLGTYFYITFLPYCFSFELGIPYALQVKRRMEHKFLLFIKKLPHNIIRCKAYGIPNAQNKTCGNVKRFLDQPDDDCHKSKHVALMLYLNVSCVDGNVL